MRKFFRTIALLFCGFIAFCIIVNTQPNNNIGEWYHKGVPSTKLAASLAKMDADNYHLYERGLKMVEEQHKKPGNYTIGQIVDMVKKRDAFVEQFQSDIRAYNQKIEDKTVYIKLAPAY